MTPSHCTTQPCPRSGMNTTEKGTWIWAAPEHRCLHRWDTGILWPHRPYVLQDSLPLGQGAHSRATECDQTQPLSLLLKQLGSAPHSQQDDDSHGAKKPCLTSSTGCKRYKPTTLPTQGITTSPAWGKTLHASIPKPVCPPKDWRHSVYAGTTLHKNIPSRPQ